MSNAIRLASEIAASAHKGQFRKWGSQAPYITHPTWCVAKATELGLPETAIAALWLHDVIEDVAIPNDCVEFYEKKINADCGQSVVDLCWELTNVSDMPQWIHDHPNPRRHEKFSANLEHIRSISDLAKQCKLIDRLHNVISMFDAPARMKMKYIPESRQILEVCKHTNRELAEELSRQIDALEATLPKAENQ